MNESGIRENASAVLLNVCVESISVGFLANGAFGWTQLPPMFSDIKTACAEENFPHRLHRDPGNALDRALRRASETGKTVQVYIDEAWMFTHSPYFCHVIFEWFGQRGLAPAPISVTGVPSK